MPPPTPKTLTRLNPAVALLWRDALTLQIGIDSELHINVEEHWVEPLLAKMMAGFRRRSFDVVAHSVGAPRQEARELLARLRPYLIEDVAQPRAVWVEGIGLSDGRCEYRMREALADEGVTIGERTRPKDIGVILVQGAAAALHLASYLRDDTAHLPVAFEPGRTTIGPLVVPGLSPCLSCRDGHERDRDPAWPRLHAQLIGRRTEPLTAARLADAATLVARVLTEQPGTFVEISADGRRVWRSLTFHEECRCREQSFLSLPGTATAAAPLDLRTETTTARAYARPA